MYGRIKSDWGFGGSIFEEYSVWELKGTLVNTTSVVRSIVPDGFSRELMVL
jgi:hypothetical protein